MTILAGRPCGDAFDSDLLRRYPGFCGGSVASKADSLALVEVEVVAVDAGSGSCVPGGCTCAAKDVDLVGHWFEMIRVDAVPHAAKVVYGQAFGDRPAQEFIGDAVGCFSLGLGTCAGPELTVPGRDDG